MTSAAAGQRSEDSWNVVSAFLAAWRREDIPGCIAVCRPDVRLTQHFSDPALPFTGVSIGTGSFAIRLAKIFSEWCFLESEIESLIVDGEMVRYVMRVALRHVASGETFDGHFRHVWIVRDGAIASCDEYLDIARLKAFLRLLGLPQQA